MALLLHHKPKHNTFTLTITNPALLRRLFSVDGGGDGGGGGDQPPSNSKSPFSSYFRDVKESLKQKNPSPLPPSPSVEEIQRNLSEFRRRTSPPPPPTDTPSFSFQELYNHRNGSQKPDEPAGDPDLRTAKKPGGGKYSFDAIRASLNQIRNSPRGGDGGMSLPAFRDMLNTTPSDSVSPSKPVIGGTSPLPESVFGRELREKMNRDGSSVAGRNMEFLKGYDHEKLGEKLKVLRPEGKAKEWFSIRELNERLMRLREIEANEPQKGILFTDLRESLHRMQNTEVDKAQKSSLQRIEILSQLGGTPNYLLASPKEHLVETYYHPDNMSSAEKLKIELEKVRDEFKMSESDCGSARVQVAQLTTKIKHLSSVLHKKDVHSRKGLLAMVQRRKRLLKYLRRTDWDSYCFVISKLGLRDNPEHTYRSRTGQAVHS